MYCSLYSVIQLYISLLQYIVQYSIQCCIVRATHTVRTLQYIATVQYTVYSSSQIIVLVHVLLQLALLSCVVLFPHLLLVLRISWCVNPPPHTARLTSARATTASTKIAADVITIEPRPLIINLLTITTALSSLLLASLYHRRSLRCLQFQCPPPLVVRILVAVTVTARSSHCLQLLVTTTAHQPLLLVILLYLLWQQRASATSSYAHHQQSDPPSATISQISKQHTSRQGWGKIQFHKQCGTSLII